MSKTLLISSVAVLLAAAVACSGSTRVELAKEMTATMTEIADVLDTVRDAASARAATPRLEKLGKKMKSTQAKAEALKGEPTAAEREQLAAYQAPLTQATGRLLQSTMRLAFSPEGRAAVEALGLGGAD